MSQRRLSLTPEQEKSLREVKAFTGASSNQAITLLKESNWNIVQAVDDFFARGYVPEPEIVTEPVDRSALAKWFATYADKDDVDYIYEEGIAQFCSDLGVDPEDPVLLVLSFHMDAATMCIFTRDEWIRGMESLGTDNINVLRAKLPELKKELDDPSMFREIYKYSFSFAKDPGQKSLALDVAIPLWKILLQKKYQEVYEWCNFLEENHSYPISKDTWMQLLDFMNVIKPGLEHYDPDGAWPVLIDDFMDWKQKSSRSS